MELELKTARGIEVTRDGRPVSTEEARSRGMAAIGRKIVTERQGDAKAGREHRALGEIEQRALDAVAPESAEKQPEPPPAATDPAPDPAAVETARQAEAQMEINRLRLELDAE